MPFRDLAAVIEHDDAVGDAHHHAHVVLDQQDGQRMLLADFEEQLVQLGGLAGVKPGGGLVEAEQHRRGAHGARDFEPPLIAIGQVAGGIVGAIQKADFAEPIGRALNGVLLGARIAFEAEKPPKV